MQLMRFVSASQQIRPTYHERRMYFEYQKGNWGAQMIASEFAQRAHWIDVKGQFVPHIFDNNFPQFTFSNVILYT